METWQNPLLQVCDAHLPSTSSLQEPWDIPQIPADLHITSGDFFEVEPEGEASHRDPQAPLSGSRPPRKRTYKPRTGSSREKNMETQRRYRQRLKEKAAAAEAALAVAAAEVEALRMEQLALRDQSSALDLLRQCSESAISMLRSAAATTGAFASSALSSLLAVHGDIVELMWTKMAHPSDSQLRLVARYCDRLPTSFTSCVVGRLINSLDHWHRSPPAGREAIERKLAHIFDTRTRLIQILVTEYPDNLETVFQTRLTTGEKDKLNAMIDQSEALYTPHVLETVALTDVQAAALRGHWENYVSKYRRAKGKVAEAATWVHAASDSLIREENSLRGVVRRNADAQRAAAAAEAYLAGERAARAELVDSAIRTLNPIQCAWFQLMAIRALPKPDIVDAVEFILPHMGSSPVPTPAALHALIISETGGEIIDIKERGVVW